MTVLDPQRLFSVGATLAALMFLWSQVAGRRRLAVQRAAIAVYAGLMAAAVGYAVLWWLGG